MSVNTLTDIGRERNSYPNLRPRPTNKHRVCETITPRTCQGIFTPSVLVGTGSPGESESNSFSATEENDGSSSISDSDPEEGLNELQKQMLEEHRKALASVNRKCVLLERDRRKRISVSCNELRELLPKFPGGRTDMVTVLERTTKYLELVKELVPADQHSAILFPPEDLYCKWQKERRIMKEKRRKKICEEIHKARTLHQKACAAGSRKKPVKNPASAAKQSSVKKSMESDNEDSLTNSGDCSGQLAVSTQPRSFPLDLSVKTFDYNPAASPVPMFSLSLYDLENPVWPDSTPTHEPLGDLFMTPVCTDRSEVESALGRHLGPPTSTTAVKQPAMQDWDQLGFWNEEEEQFVSVSQQPMTALAVERGGAPALGIGSVNRVLAPGPLQTHTEQCKEKTCECWEADLSH
ncbi:hypothetical protein HHUSO_G17190 [Huso huso]|uniref:BHLH domain-containing protein n=1 Tax=Huso huso TaxID=61971 RepID=A0ABR0Z885_HUSHU